MTTITIHLGKEMDAAAGPSRSLLGGQISSPTADLILIPNDFKGKTNLEVKTAIISSEKSSEKTAERLGLSIEEINKQLDGWNLGILKEKSQNDLIQTLPIYIDLDPEKKIEGGESFNSFKDRIIKEIKEILKKNQSLALVIDPTTLKLIKAYAEEKSEREDRGSDSEILNIDSDVFCKYGFKNLNILELEVEDGKLKIEEEESEEEGE